MKKEKLTKRIANAVRALRGNPWPVVFEPILPKMEATPLRLETFKAEKSVPLEFVDLQGREVLDETIRREMATRIGKKLMTTGFIEITKKVDVDAGTLTYMGRVRVAMPEEEKHG